MKKLALILLALTSAPAMAADSPLHKCRAIADNVARLACYDALVPAAVAAPVASTASTAAPVPAAAAGAAAAPVAAAAKPDDSFGIFSMGKKTEPDSIETTIPGAFDGWRPGTLITFANGQVWRVSDDSSNEFGGRDIKAKLVKGMFGVVYLEVEGSNRTAKVKRIK